MAVPARTALGLQQCQLHHLGGHQWRVQAHRSRRGGPSVGRTQVQAQYELRQVEPRLEVSFKEIYIQFKYILFNLKVEIKVLKKIYGFALMRS